MQQMVRKRKEVNISERDSEGGQCALFDVTGSVGFWSGRT